jgi:hypothetical protein
VPTVKLPRRDSFVVPCGTEAVSVSLWDDKEQVEAYQRGTDPSVLKALAHVIEGTPQERHYEVSNSTFYKIVAHASPSDAKRSCVCSVGGHGHPLVGTGFPLMWLPMCSLS